MRTAQQLKWQWGGHVCRLDAARWAYATTTKDQRTGKRTVGRPWVKWADLFRKVAGKKWTRVVKYRNVWRAFQKAHEGN